MRFGLHEEAVGLLAAFAEDDEEGWIRIHVLWPVLTSVQVKLQVFKESCCPTAVSPLGYPSEVTLMSTASIHIPPALASVLALPLGRYSI